MITYPAGITEEPEGGFTLQFIDFPDAMAEGDTIEELTENAEDVLNTIVSYRYETEKEIPTSSSVSSRKDIINIPLYPEVELPVLIRRFRTEMGLSQKEISEKIGVSYTTFQRWEKVAKFNPTVRTLTKIARVLGKEVRIELV